MFESGFHDLLAEDGAIQALIAPGSPPARSDNRSGVFPVQVPENAPLPYLVFTGVAGANLHSHDGPSLLESKRLQVDCYARTYLAAKQLAAAVRDLLTNCQGEPLSDGSTLDAAILAANFDSFEEAPFTYRVILDFDLWFTNAA